MPEIIWKYYMAKGPEADEVLAKARQAWEAVKAGRESLMEEYHANGVLPGDRRKYTIAGLLYYEKPDFDFMIYTEAAQKTADGRTFYVARPKVNDMNGRELARKLAAPEVTFDRKNELISLLGLACMADFTASANQTSTSLVWSSATAVDGGIAVKMPADASKQHILGTPPKIPHFLKLISKEAYDQMVSAAE